MVLLVFAGICLPVSATTTVTVTSISPTTGSTAGGTSVTIAGTGFTNATAVIIGGATATNFSVVSDTSITATTPPGIAGVANVIVTTSSSAPVTGTGLFTYTTPAPTFASVSPATGSTAGGTLVIITGSGFTGTTAVTFGDVEAASFQVVSSTSISAVTPAGTAGSANVVITTPGGTTTGTGVFTYTAIPTVTAVSPAYGPVSTSTAITITGTGFTGATAVTVGGTAATSVTVVSATEITATTPASTTVGTVDVLVTTQSGTSTAVAGDKYTFAATATTIPVPIFSASPTSGSAPLSVTFTDASTGSPASWSWIFGDGNTSTLENPTNTYVNNGTYSVTLTEKNSVGSNTTTMTDYIVVGAVEPVAGFTANPISGTAPLMIQFTDSSTNTPTSWTWDFGDGGTSSAQNPVHTYSTAGTYTVTLIATNTEGSNVATKTNLITVTGGAQTATQVTPIPTSLAPTFAITAAKTTDSSTADWLAKQKAVVATTTKKSPGCDMISTLIGCGVIAGISLRTRR
jgi:PKD repeat protein